jgi:hypothetical protein
MIRAERLLGELLIEAEKRGQRAKPGDKESGRGKRPLSTRLFLISASAKTIPRDANSSRASLQKLFENIAQQESRW